MNHFAAEVYAASDGKLAVTPKGTPIYEFRGCTHSGWGENRLTTFWTLKLVGRFAEKMEICKGNRMFIAGAEVRIVEFQRKDGSKGSSPELILGVGSNISLIDVKPRRLEPEELPIPTTPQPEQPTSGHVHTGVANTDDNCPF
jgi:hypothetical protein